MTSLHPATPPRRRIRPDAALHRQTPLRQLGRLIEAEIGGECEVLAALDGPWASALFEGLRCTLLVVVDGDDATARVDRFARDLREMEWPMNGYFVADIQIDVRSSDPQCELLILSALVIRDW